MLVGSAADDVMMAMVMVMAVKVMVKVKVMCVYKIKNSKVNSVSQRFKEISARISIIHFC